MMKSLGVKEYFDKYAKEYIGQERYGFKWYKWLVDEIIREASPRKGQRILDLGTGTGILAVKMSRQVGGGGLILGIDASGKMLGAARQAVKNGGLKNVRFRRGLIEDMDFPPDSFDTVVTNLALDHVQDIGSVLVKARGCLRRNGRLVIGLFFMPEEAHLDAVLRMRRRNPLKAREADSDWQDFINTGVSEGYRDQHPEEREIGQLGLKRLMEKAGFVNVKIIMSYKPEVSVLSGVKR
jgi:ubiquinone/menaquinone biosynthesis C-methylase UbiE